MGNEQNILYREWRERLEYRLIDRYGFDLDDAHTYNLRAWFNQGLTTVRAADIIAEEEGWE